MNLIRGKKYAEDVKDLKVFNGENIDDRNPKCIKYPRKYKRLKAAILKEYKISQATLYRDMNEKPVPGQRRVRCDTKEFRKLLTKVVKFFCEELSNEKALFDVMNEAKIKFNFKFDFANTNLIMSRVKKNKPELFVGDKPLANLKKMLKDIFKMYKEGGEDFNVTIVDKDTPLNADDQSIIVMVLSRAYNRVQQDPKKKLVFDNDKLLENRIRLTLDEALRNLEDKPDSKELKRITDMYLDLKKKTLISAADLDCIMKLVKRYDPTATEDDILSQLEVITAEENSNVN